MTDKSSVSQIAVLKTLSELNEHREFVQVIERARLIGKAGSVFDDPIKRSTYHFELAYAFFHIGQYSISLVRVRAALRILSKQTDFLLMSRYKNLLGLNLLALGRPAEAAESFNESYVFRKNSGQLQDVYGSLINQSLALFASGNLSEARLRILLAADFACKHNTISEVRLCKLNQLCLEIVAGNLVSADEICGFLRGGQLSEFESGRLSLRESSIGLYRLHRREAKNGLLTALQLLRTKHDLRHVAVCLEYLGLNEYFAGNYQKAKDYYQQVLDMPEPTASAVAQTLRMLTDVHIAEGHWELARQTAAKADAAITKISERIELGALWRAYGQIHAHDGNRDEARAFFTKSIELLRQLGARYELALSYFDAGRSEVFSASERMEHLRTARSLFVDMDVPKRVVQVDAAIKQLEADCTSGTASGRQTAAISSRHSRGGGNPARSSLILKSPAAPTIIAASDAMKRIMSLADRVKDSDLTILITGETGTGKDLLAEYIHKTSNRADKPWRVINSAAMPESLLEAELFGYTKGTYSGATADRPGLIELTDGGSFCFDEIGETPPAIQAKLLRLLDFKVVRRLGAAEDRQVDVRFIALTNRDLEQMVREGSFRKDLYHRLCQLPIHLPPLRERTEDIVPLMTMLLERNGIELNGATAETVAMLHRQLESYSWPGNARELIAMITRVAALLDGNGNSDVVELLRQQLGVQDAEGSERRRLFEALRRHSGNRSQAARELGIPVTTLKYRLKKFNA